MKRILYGCIQEVSTEYPVKLLCALADVSRAGYYGWLKSQDNPSPRVVQEQNYNIGKPYAVFPNILDRDFKASRPMEKVVTDVTSLYIPGGKKLYLCAYLDLYNNEILDYEISERNDLQLVMKPAKRLLKKSKDIVIEAAIFHSDQGSQYTSRAYCLLLEKNGIIQSMSRKGTPLDNAPCESFFGLFKDELYADYRPRTIHELVDAVHKQSIYHNHERPQTRLKSETPVEYRYRHLA